MGIDIPAEKMFLAQKLVGTLGLFHNDASAALSSCATMQLAVVLGLPLNATQSFSCPFMHTSVCAHMLQSFVDSCRQYHVRRELRKLEPDLTHSPVGGR